MSIPEMVFLSSDYRRGGDSPSRLLGCRLCYEEGAHQVQSCHQELLADRDALRKALNDGTIATIGTDHARTSGRTSRGDVPRRLTGMPMVQFSLVSMLELVDQGVLTIERMVELMAHQQAQLFQVAQRGFLRRVIRQTSSS